MADVNPDDAALLGAEKELEKVARKLGVICSNCGQIIEEPPPPKPIPASPPGTCPFCGERSPAHAVDCPTLTTAADFETVPLESVTLYPPMPPAFEYVTLEPGFHEGRAGTGILRDVVCTRDSCEDAREELEKAANFRRPFRAWTILPGGPFGKDD